MEFPNLYKIMNQIGQELVAELKKELQDKGKDASGKLINSLNYDLIQTDTGYDIKIISEPYLKFVDQGRRPGAKMPPSSKLVPWIESKGIKFAGGTTTAQAAYVIARSIGDKGIKPANVVESSMQKVYNNRKDDISKAVAKDYQEFIQKIWYS